MNRWIKLAYCAAIFLVVFGARLWLIDRCGSDAPAWDQWDGIGGNLFLPYAGHTLTAGDFFKPHNEHRILFTRLLSLGLMLANHQWDNRLETVANAGLVALTAVFLLGMILQWGPRQVSVPLGFPAVALAFALPFSWENTLFGFQSQFYFLILFSIAAMALLVLNPPWTGRWLTGWGFALLCIFTTASGFLAAGAVLAFAVFEGMRSPRRRKAAGVTLGAAAVIILAGWALNVTLERHQALRAHSVLQLIVAFGQNLSWPNLLSPERYTQAGLIWPSLKYPWLAVLNWTPFVLLAWAYWRSEGGYPKLERFTLVLGLWVVLQSAAMAYARGGSGWRYMDVMSLGMVVNVMGIGLLLMRRPRPRAAGWLIAIFMAWIAISGAGLLILTRHAAQVEIPRKMFLSNVQRENIRAFVATGAGRCLTGKSADQISYPASDAWVMICLLRDPFIRDILPAGIRMPLRVIPDPLTAAIMPTFGTNIPSGVTASILEHVWSSYGREGLADEGVFRSQSLSSRYPFLRFEAAGDLGEDYMDMKLVCEADHREMRIHPRRVPGAVWTPVMVKTPRGEFRIEAADDHARRWLAFKDPVEIGWLSWLAIRLAQKGDGILAAGILLFGIIGLYRYFSALGGVNPIRY